jgi:GAF domain-containing protein
MRAAPIPENEAARLETLRQYQVLDTDSEDAFDDLTRLACYVCDAPTALISLVDANRQWFKARVGVRARETARSISFCGHAISQKGCFIIEDALADERFADNPLVISEPFIRFYAGMPLLSPEGFAIGTLCVMDRKPRTLNYEQINALKMLSDQVMSQLELRREVRFVTRALERHKQEEAKTSKLKARSV